MILYHTIVSRFDHGDTVTVTLYDLSNGNAIVSSASCLEIGSTGYFKYQPTLVRDSHSYLYVMSNGVAEDNKFGVLEAADSPYQYIVSQFNHGDTVTITLMDLSDNSITVNGAACSEIGSTGYYRYAQLIERDSSKTYLFTMSNGISDDNKFGVIEPIDDKFIYAQIETITTDIDGIKEDVVPIPTIQSDLATVKNSQGAAITSIEEDISSIPTIQSDLEIVKTTQGADLTSIKEDLESLPTMQSDIGSIKTTQGAAITSIVSDITDIKESQDDIKADQATILVNIPAHGAGAKSWTYKVKNAVTHYPIPDARVWVSTDIRGHNVIASGRSDQYGDVMFMLDPGPVYLWVAKIGYNFTNPDLEVVPA